MKLKPGQRHNNSAWNKGLTYATGLIKYRRQYEKRSGIKYNRNHDSLTIIPTVIISGLSF